MFGAIPVFISIILDFLRIALHYYAVINVIFHYCTISMRDMGNRNMVKSTTKCQGIHGARKGHPVYTTESQKITDK